MCVLSAAKKTNDAKSVRKDSYLAKFADSTGEPIAGTRIPEEKQTPIKSISARIAPYSKSSVSEEIELIGVS